MKKIHYRDLRKYKYQLTLDVEVQTSIKGYRVTTTFLELYPDGRLVVRKGYAWDGPSGPTVDTDTFMRGSCVHDALYQLIRDGHLPQSERYAADVELRVICLGDGMNGFRAWYVYRAVRMFGGFST